MDALDQFIADNNVPDDYPPGQWKKIRREAWQYRRKLKAQ